MTILRNVIIVTGVLSMALTANAMDIVQVYQAALAQDANIKAARATADAGRENLPQARAQLLPNVSFGATRNTNQLSSTTPDFLGALATSNFNYPSSNDTLTIRQPLFRMYQWSQYKQAQAQVDDVNAVLENELQNLATKVGGLYFEALLAQEQLLLMTLHRASYVTQLDAARRIFEAGSGTRTDVDDVQARLDMTIAQELEAKQNVDYTRGQLEALINQPVGELAALDASKLPLVPPDPDNLDVWKSRAEQNSSELKVLRARVEAASKEVDKASAGHYPTLDAIAQWSNSTSENSTSVKSSYTNQSVGVQLSIPIYAGGEVSSAVRQALANKERAEQNLEAGRRDLGMRVHKEYRGVTEGVLRVKALEQAVRSAEQALESSQRSVQAGSRSRLDVLNAERNKVSTMRDLAQARYIYLMSALRLKPFVGEADISSMEAINKWLAH